MAGSSTASAVGYRDDAVIAALLRGRGQHVMGRDPGAGRAALAGLAQQLADDPERLLQQVAEAVRALCAADSVVIAVRVSAQNGGQDGEEVCWNAVAGGLAGQAGKRWPLQACPCGASVLADGAVLFGRPDTEFESIRASGAPVGEALGVPWRVRGHPAGALVAMLDGDDQHFDAEDLQLLRELAGFAAAAYQASGALESTESLQREVEESRAAERALREHKALIDATLSISTVGVVYFDLDGSIRHVNQAYQRMTGYSADEVHVPGNWKELGDTGVTRPYTRQMVRKDGSRWWGLYAPARISGEGAQARCVCFILDVSELKEAEARLADSEQRFRALVEGFSQAVWENDRDANLVLPSPSWCAYTGQPEPASLGKGWLDAVHPDDRDEVRREWRAALETRRAVNIEHRVQVATGGWRWTNVRAAPLFNPDGSLRKWFGMNIDIDEKRRTQDALRESEARFRALADASPALIYQFDPDGQLMYLNQRGTAQVQPEDMHAYLRDVCEGIRQRAAYTQRIRVPARDGGWRWFESHAAPWYSGDGLQRGYVGISLDITGAVQAEEALRDADRRKDEFLAVLAHELRNPLAPISNAVQLMRRPDGRRQADRVVEMIGRQVRQIVRLVDDLMEVSRITRGKIDLRLERVPVAEVVHSAVESSQLAIERAGHQLVVALPEEPLVLMADRVRLTQVFTNLLNNAAKYTDAGGRIRVDVWREDGQMLASVRDTGIGIPAESLPRVFDMFAQAHRAVGRGQGGLGIGLTMVRSLVEMHHGSVEAHSAGSGMGSEFVVRLPLASQEEGWTDRPGPDAVRPYAPFAGQRILVVDDNRDAADTLAMLLEGDGAEVRVAYDGRAALATAESFLPSSVLLDIGMPGMDGWEVARRLRQDERFIGLRIVALTGWGQDADRRQTRNRGFTHHLTKPVSLEELHQILI